MSAEQKPENTAWNNIFTQSGRVFIEVQEDIPDLAQRLHERGAKRVLDLGCGTGRNLVYLCEQGFELYGLDNSVKAIELANAWLAEKGLYAELRLQDMTTPLPYPDAFFEAVISIQVIHHATCATIRQIIADVERVTKPGALIFITVPCSPNAKYQHEQIEPGTWVPVEGPEKGLPHHFFQPEELLEFFNGFQPLAPLYRDSTYHRCLLAEKQ